MPDRYRDISPKCERFLPPPHYLANSLPLVSSGGSINNISMGGANSIVTNTNDNYISGYLSATVHTPIKRYVPTPSLSTEIYSEPLSSHQQQQQAVNNSNAYHHVSHLPQISQSQQLTARNTPQSSTLPYRYRMKCCSNMDQQLSSTLQPSVSHSSTSTINNAADHYATPPRGRLVSKVTNSSACQSPTPIAPMTTNSSSAQSSSYASTINGSTSGRSSSRNMQNDHSGLVRSPSIEYLGQSASGGAMVNSCRNANVMSPHTSDNFTSTSTSYANPSSSNAMNGNGLSNISVSGTCLHCSTIRRTTGVHQTTQTTGPISPIPQTTGGMVSHDLSGTTTGCIDSENCLNGGGIGHVGDQGDASNSSSANNSMSYQSAMPQHCSQEPDPMSAAGQQYSMSANLRQQQISMLHQAHNQIGSTYPMAARNNMRLQNQVRSQYIQILIQYTKSS